MIIDTITPEIEMILSMNDNAREEWLPSFDTFGNNIGLIEVRRDSCAVTLEYAVEINGKLWMPYHTRYSEHRKKDVYSLKTYVWAEGISNITWATIKEKNEPLRVEFCYDNQYFRLYDGP